MNKRNLQFVNYSGNCLSKEFEIGISSSCAVFHLELSIAKRLALQKNEKLTDFRKLSSVYVPLFKSKIIHDESIVKSAAFDSIKSDGNFETFKDFVVASEKLNEIHIEQWFIDEVDTSKNIKQFTTVRSLTIDTLVSESKYRYRIFLKSLFTLFPNLNRLELCSGKFIDPFYFPHFKSMLSLPPISHFTLKNFRLTGVDETNFFFYLENTRQLKALHLSNFACSPSPKITRKIPVKTLHIDCADFLLSITIEYLLDFMPDIYLLMITNTPTYFMNYKDRILKRLKNLRNHQIESKKLYSSLSLYRI